MGVANEPGVMELIALSKLEDLGEGDLSSDLLPDAGDEGTFAITAEQEGVLAGCEIAPAVLYAYDKSIKLDWADVARDGCSIDRTPITLATIRGPVGTVLSAERVLLNFLQRLCGIATLTRAYVREVEGTAAVILDTRKTVPGWRYLEKYAVRCGGGSNHRMGLFDAVLIKDNHLAGVATPRRAGVVFEMLNTLAASGRRPQFVAVEADAIEQVVELLKVVGIDVILLDNFSLSDLRAAVELRDGCGLKGKVALEASGGVTIDTVRAIADTGVDRISVGAITHSAPALDLSLDRI